ncbi:MAG: TraB family protein [Nanohaloarchaea archaeon]|nr:TraB family protein [Candidatus Nanohaloarchaea archaeon]
MQKNIDRITLNKKEIILVGTAHISKKSADLVKTTIETEKPDTVCVELCKSRYAAMTKKKKWNDTKITDLIKDKKAYLFLSNLLLANFEKKMGENVKVQPGSEMIEAIKTAKKNKIKISLVDRDIQITLKRAWKMMGLEEKFKLMFILFEGMFFENEKIDEKQIEKLKKEDMLSEMLKELGQYIPNIKKVLINERDTYLAQKIKDTKGKKIIVVVGAGHVPGIKKNLKKTTDLKTLEAIPKNKNITKYIGWSIPLIFTALIIYGFMGHGTEVTLNMLYKWMIINGSLSAIGALFALAHPITIIVAFFAAPLTSLNPMLASGWFAGLSEAKIKEPRVKDFESLSTLGGITGFWKNRVTRILLIVVFSNMGSTIGTFIALPYLASLL